IEALVAVAISGIMQLTPIPVWQGFFGNKALAGHIPGVAGNRRGGSKRRGAKRRGAKHRAKSQKLAREMGISDNADNADTASERGSGRLQPTMGKRWVRVVRQLPGVAVA